MTPKNELLFFQKNYQIMGIPTVLRKKLPRIIY